MIGSRLKSLRKEKKLTQAKLANILGVSQQSIAFYENDKREPEIKILKKIADYFDVSVDYLLGRSNYKNDDINLEDLIITAHDKGELPDDHPKELNNHIKNIVLRIKKQRENSSGE